MGPSLFIFRRDLRLEDNTGLRAALSAGPVLPVFFLDPRQIGPENPYRSPAALSVMAQSLLELSDALRAEKGQLLIVRGPPHEHLPALLSRYGITAVHANRDYTPFARGRDEALVRACAASRAPFHLHDDYLLHPPGSVLKSDGTPYTVFTPFHNAARQMDVGRPSPLPKKRAWVAPKPHPSDAAPLALLRSLVQPRFPHGGRKAARAHLSRIPTLKDYAQTRDRPDLDATSHLSPHLKFGTLSAREAYWAAHDTLGAGHRLLAELYWRDFFTHIAFHFPHVFGQPFKPAFKSLVWRPDPALLEAWKSGRTGFPLVDAGMRELERTGLMHNRVRMVAASFLVKDLHLDWREGERHFATRLADYDPAVNNGNWQWAASTGCDSQPYFRIFNPWLQQRRFDPECAYVKRWVPELAGLSAEGIHSLEKNRPAGLDYPKPVVDHKTAAAQAIALFKSAASRPPG